MHVLNPSKNRAGNRTYKDEDIKIIRHIKELLYEKKFTIRGAKQYLEEYYSSKNKNSKNIVSISSQNVDKEFLINLKKSLQDTIEIIDSLKD